MKENKDEITRGEAIKKMGRYAGFAALGTFMILNPQKSQAQSTPSDHGGWGGSQEVILEMLLEVNLQVNGGSLKTNKSFQIKLICILNNKYY